MDREIERYNYKNVRRKAKQSTVPSGKILKDKLSPFQIVRNIVNPSVKEVKAHDLTTNSPWPQPSPMNPYKMPNTVIHVPQEEITNFLDKVVKRYINTLKFTSVASIKQTLTKNIIERVSNAEFSEYVFRTCYGRQLTKKISMREEEIFFDYIEEDKEYFIFNLETLNAMKTYKDMFVEDTITLFEDVQGEKRPVAIFIKEQVVPKYDIERFDLAKIYVLQGAAIVLTACIHPKIHFPVDSVNGITKVLIPTDHVMYQLLEPHMYIQLPLNFAVQYVNKSVAHGNQNEIYTPYPTDKVGFFGQMAIGYKGLPGQEKYQAYKYPMSPEVLETDYGSFLTEYWWSIYRFVEDVCEHIDRDSEMITHWAESISHYVPGFPSAKDIRLKDNLERALTSYIHTCSVSHAADHYTYSRIPLRHAPLRNRAPFPEKHIMNFKFDIKSVVTKEDFIRHKFCNIMYFKENNLTLLKDCNYGFRSRKLETAVQRFKADLRQTEKQFQDNNYIPLDEISASIQY